MSLRYLRTARAATPLEPAAPSCDAARPGIDPGLRPPTYRVLWATVPWVTTTHRLVAVRLRGSTVEVASCEGPRIHWLPAERVLTNRQVEAWRQTSRFEKR